MKKKDNRGGARPGSGRKSKPDEEKKQAYRVYLLPDVKNEIVKKYGSLTKALESKLPSP